MFFGEETYPKENFDLPSLILKLENEQEIYEENKINSSMVNFFYL